MSRGARYFWRRIERAMLGAVMVLVARLVERRVIRAVQRRATSVG